MNKNARIALENWRKENPNPERSPQKNPYKKWLENNTRKSAIGALCWTCMGGTKDESNGATISIKECTSNGLNGAIKCPLYEWRPYK